MNESTDQDKLKAFGTNLKFLRTQKGISQEEFSEKIDISPRHMCTIENGKSLPSIETFVKISKILDIDINKFFNLTPENSDNLLAEIYNLIQISTQKELSLIKDIIKAIQVNR